MIEWLKNNRIARPLAGAAAILVLSVAVYRYQTTGTTPPPLGPYYYSVDDGRSYFTSDALRFPPFTENGQEAVAAAVYTGLSHQPFVGFLYKYSAAGRALLAPVKMDTPSIRAETARYCLVKRPGESEWVPATSRRGAEIIGKVLDPKTNQPATVYTPS